MYIYTYMQHPHSNEYSVQNDFTSHKKVCEKVCKIGGQNE